MEGIPQAIPTSDDHVTLERSIGTQQSLTTGDCKHEADLGNGARPKVSTSLIPGVKINDIPEPAFPDDVREQKGGEFSMFVSPPGEEPSHQAAAEIASQTKALESELASPQQPHHVQHESQSCLGPRAAPNTAAQFAGGSILPSNSAQSTYSDEGQWDSIFPETIVCRIELFSRDKRPYDKAPHRKHLDTKGPKALRWHEKATYEGPQGLISSSHHKLQGALQGDATELYIRYGTCRVIGFKHEACEELEDPSQLEEKAISLVCGFIRDYKYERFRLEITWEYATVQIGKLPDEDYVETVARAISNKIVQNYAKKSYIPRKDLVRIMLPEVTQRIIEQDESLRKADWTPDQRRDFARQVELHSSRLQAVCICQGLPMRFLKHLTDLGVRDIKSLGEEFELGHQCPERNCPTYLRKFFEMYHGFFAHKFNPDGKMKIFTEDMVLPIYYASENKDSKKDSRLGFGAASNVYEVKIDPVHHCLSHVSRLPSSIGTRTD
jgi:hypothetical protein